MKALWFVHEQDLAWKILIAALIGKHHADRKREAYDPGLTAFKDCIILRSLEGDSSARALDRSIAQLLTSDGREFARITLDSNDDSRVLQLAQ